MTATPQMDGWVDTGRSRHDFGLMLFGDGERVALEVQDAPEHDFIGFGPPPGCLCAVGADDGFENVVVVVSKDALRRAAVSLHYRNRGWRVVEAATRDGFMFALETGICPSVIVTDQLDFVAQVRAVETSHVPPVPIYAVVEDAGMPEAYMHGATATLPMSLFDGPDFFGL